MSFPRLLLAVVLALAGPFVATVSPVTAAEGCGSGGGPGQVIIDAPAPNAVVSGAVQVRGTASVGLGAVGEISRVEATLGGITHGRDFEASDSVDFNITIDASNIAPGQKQLVVVACGTSLTGAILGRGSASVPVKVEAAPVVTSTTQVRTTTTLGSGAAGSGAGTPAAGGTTTTSGAGTAGAAGGLGASGTSTTVTTTDRPTTTEAEVRDAGRARPEPVRPGSGRDAPLVLTEEADEGSSGPPLWVGDVVGISGGLGLLFSAASWRRRSHGPARAEPVDPDLVNVP